MIPSLPRPLWLRAGTVFYALAFFAFLFLPLLVVLLPLVALNKIAVKTNE